MRFRASVRSVPTLSKVAQSLGSLGKVAWLKLEEEYVRFTVIPEQGTQVWAVLSIDTIFENYILESAAPGNVINLELPLGPFQRALKSAQSSAASVVNVRLTKKGANAILSIIITSSSMSTQGTGFEEEFGSGPVRETVITQDVPIVVLQPQRVEGIHEPVCPEADVNIYLPPLIQVKAVSERFNRLAVVNAPSAAAAASTKLQLSADMHGHLRLSLETDALSISSVWDSLQHPVLDMDHLEGGEEAYAQHPTTIMRQKQGEDAWATVRIDGKDWSRVLNVGRLARKVIASFCHDHALILYVYLSSGDHPSVLTLIYNVMSCGFSSGQWPIQTIRNTDTPVQKRH